MWEGYVTLGGNEIINAARSQAYAKAFGLRWLKRLYDEVNLPLILGEGRRYRTPLLDDAPWTDPDNLASYEFLGFHPIGISGLEDSSRTADVTEYISDGGSAGRIRHATRSAVFNGLILAASEAGAEYGMAWLRSATLPSPCDSPGVFGADLCYLSSEPLIDPPDRPAALALLDGGHSTTTDFDLDLGDAYSIPDWTFDGGDADDTMSVLYESEGIFIVDPAPPFDPNSCLSPLLRTRRKFTVLDGPAITKKYAPKQGALWSVQFTGVAGVPWEFGQPVEIINGFLGSNPSGIAENVDSDGIITPEVNCNTTRWGPMVDPLCPVIVAPPAPPTIGLGCADIPSSWRRRQFSIPANAVPLWTDMVPVVQIHAPADQDLRMLRLRFYVDPFGDADPSLDPCNFCGEMLVSLVPANATMTIDGSIEAIHVTSSGGVVRRADALVYRSDGTPFLWPALSCGSGYVVTVDLPQLGPLPTIDLDLVPLVR